MSVIGQPIPINNLLGARSVPGRTIPDSITHVDFVFGPSGMTDPAMQCDLVLDYSLDGGQTWTNAIDAQFIGGSPSKFGQNPYVFGANIPAGVNRQVQGSLTVSGVALTTTLTINAS